MTQITRIVGAVWIGLLVAGIGSAIAAPALNGDSPGLSTQISGDILLYKVQRGDSLSLISSRFGVSLSRLMSENELNLDSRIYPGQVLHVDSRHIAPQAGADGIVINVPQRMLFFFRGGRLLRNYAVGLGRRTWPTPLGAFTVVEKETDPTWDVPASIQEEMRQEGKRVLTRVPPGPDNPLGKYFLRIGPALGIHGTIVPGSIYRFQTHGCIRLHPNDVADLFPQVTVGTPVHIMYAPVLLARINGAIYLEAHEDIYDRAPEAESTLQEWSASAGISDAIDWDLASDVLSRREGVPINVSRLKPGVSRAEPEKDNSHARYQSRATGETTQPSQVSFAFDPCGSCDFDCAGGSGEGNQQQRRW